MKNKLLLPALLLALTATAGNSSPSQEPQKKPGDIRVDVTVSAITIAVTVQDKGGKYINNLEAKDFAIYENTEKRNFTYFKHNFMSPISLTSARLRRNWILGKWAPCTISGIVVQ